jgi:hypothetical protein
LATISNKVKVKKKKKRPRNERNLKEIGAMDETEIERIEWKECKIEAMNIRDKEFHSLVYAAYQDKAISSTLNFQNISFCHTRNF